MDEQNQNMEAPQNQNMGGQEMPSGNEHKHGNKSNGALIGSIIIIIILIVGGIYLFKDKAEDLREGSQDLFTGELMEGEEVEGSDVELSGGDDLSDLEADLDAVENMELDATLE